MERLTFIKSNHSVSKNRVDDDEKSEKASEDVDSEELIKLILICGFNVVIWWLFCGF